MNNQTDTITVNVVKNAAHKDAFYIGRGTPLGNPFPMLGDESMRDEVCDKYEAYFQKKIAESDEAILNELSRCLKSGFENGYIKLGCFCAPLRCHGLTIKRFLDEALCNPQS